MTLLGPVPKLSLRAKICLLTFTVALLGLTFCVKIGVLPWKWFESDWSLRLHEQDGQADAALDPGVDDDDQGRLEMWPPPSPSPPP